MAQTCTAQWDFAYGGRLAGDSLKPRHIAPILGEGRAWGAGVAAYHQRADGLFARMDAIAAIRESIDEDLAFMAENDVMTDASIDQRTDMLLKLERMLMHYVDCAEPFANLTRLEDTLDVPILARTETGRASTRYRYGAKIDGFTIDDNGDEWIVEFKLRKRLQPRWIIELMRQYRWYAWARQRESKRKVVGVIVDERLNAVPSPPRILKNGAVSSDVKQVTTKDAYLQACLERDQAPDLDVVLALQSRVWQQRVHILFRPGELAEAGKELTAAALDIRNLDSGAKHPIRNASERQCGGCRYRRICAEPSGQLVDELFLRTVPKRLRTDEPPPTPMEDPIPEREPAPF